MSMKKSIIGLVLTLALGCEIRPLPFSRVNISGQPPNVISACEYNFYHTGPKPYEQCISQDNIGDCNCYRVLDYTVINYECYADYCFHWDTCQWEMYDYACY